MSTQKTTLKITKETNISLMIVSRLQNKTKEELAEHILQEGLKPMLKDVQRYKFL